MVPAAAAPRPSRGSRPRSCRRCGAEEILLSFPRTDYFQVAYFNRKGMDAQLRAEGVERFRERVARLRPGFADRLDAITSTDDLHHLDVRLDRLRRWHRPGLLLIGDAAHAMSPAGGVGINLAVQDAVAAAAVLAGPLRERRVLEYDLAAVQRRRWWPTAVVQRPSGGCTGWSSGRRWPAGPRRRCGWCPRSPAGCRR